MKARLNKGLEPQLFYYRDNHQHEVDVIYKKSNQLIPIEIKASETFTPGFLKGLQYYAEIVGQRCEEGFLVYAGEHEQSVDNIKVINYKNAHRIVK